MTRKIFEHELQSLIDRIDKMAEAVGQALYQAVEGLRQHQLVLAQAVIEGDKAITREYYSIEESALTLIATNAPVATDLRRIAAVMNIAAELERMGDHAKGIARLTGKIQDKSLAQSLSSLPQMSEICRTMLKQAISAFKELNAKQAHQIAAQAHQIAAQDDQMDDLYHELFLNMLQLMNDKSVKVDDATYILWVAHNLERFGDRTVNICERIIFVATGEMVEIIGHLNG